ncbi:MAG: site-specific DNA-methyltransferase [Bacteroidota bacterium]
MSKKLSIFQENCYKLSKIKPSSIHAIITDPPYGISYQANEWDRALPDPKIWKDCLKVLKPGGFMLIFSSIRLMHRLMVHLEDNGFIIKDVLQWVYLNGMPKNRNLGLAIDKTLGAASEIVGTYNYVQGYKKGGANSYTPAHKKKKYKPASKLGKTFDGAGLALKPAYEPIIMVQKPLEKGLNLAENLILHGTGALNLEESRIPYAKGEGKVGHNPHPAGRVPANLIRTEDFADGYDKYFVVPKVRQHAADFNDHPTLKPLALMQHLVKLVSFPDQLVLDPFMGSGSTGVACLNLDRKFAGYEREEKYYRIARTRLELCASLPLTYPEVLEQDRKRSKGNRAKTHKKISSKS